MGVWRADVRGTAFRLLHVAGVTALLGAGCASAPATSVRTPAIVRADSAVSAALAFEDSLGTADVAVNAIAVLPFDTRGLSLDLEPLGFALADLLMTDLARSSQVQVVDRLRIHSLLREMELGEEGIVSTGEAPRAGRLVGAETLLFGSLSLPEEGTVGMEARLADAVDASVRPAGSGTASVDQIMDAERSIALEVLASMGINLTPAERAAIEQRPTRSLAALLAFGRATRAEANLGLREAARQYREAVRLDPGFEEAADRLADLEPYVLEPLGIVTRSIESVNPADTPPPSDVADPAFSGSGAGTLIINIDIR